MLSTIFRQTATAVDNEPAADPIFHPASIFASEISPSSAGAAAEAPEVASGGEAAEARGGGGGCCRRARGRAPPAVPSPPSAALLALCEARALDGLTARLLAARGEGGARGSAGHVGGRAFALCPRGAALAELRRGELCIRRRGDGWATAAVTAAVVLPWGAPGGSLHWLCWTPEGDFLLLLTSAWAAAGAPPGGDGGAREGAGEAGAPPSPAAPPWGGDVFSGRCAGGGGGEVEHTLQAVCAASGALVAALSTSARGGAGGALEASLSTWAGALPPDAPLLGAAALGGGWDGVEAGAPAGDVAEGDVGSDARALVAAAWPRAYTAALGIACADGTLRALRLSWVPPAAGALQGALLASACEGEGGGCTGVDGGGAARARRARETALRAAFEAEWTRRQRAPVAWARAASPALAAALPGLPLPHAPLTVLSGVDATPSLARATAVAFAPSAPRGGGAVARVAVALAGRAAAAAASGGYAAASAAASGPVSAPAGHHALLLFSWEVPLSGGGGGGGVWAAGGPFSPPPPPPPPPRAGAHALAARAEAGWAERGTGDPLFSWARPPTAGGGAREHAPVLLAAFSSCGGGGGGGGGARVGDADAAVPISYRRRARDGFFGGDGGAELLSESGGGGVCAFAHAAAAQLRALCFGGGGGDARAAAAPAAAAPCDGDRRFDSAPLQGAPAALASLPLRGAGRAGCGDAGGALPAGGALLSLGGASAGAPPAGVAFAALVHGSPSGYIASVAFSGTAEGGRGPRYLVARGAGGGAWLWGLTSGGGGGARSGEGGGGGGGGGGGDDGGGEGGGERARSGLRRRGGGGGSGGGEGAPLLGVAARAAARSPHPPPPLLATFSHRGGGYLRGEAFSRGGEGGGEGLLLAWAAQGGGGGVSWVPLDGGLPASGDASPSPATDAAPEPAVDAEWWGHPGSARGAASDEWEGLLAAAVVPAAPARPLPPPPAWSNAAARFGDCTADFDAAVAAAAAAAADVGRPPPLSLAALPELPLAAAVALVAPCPAPPPASGRRSPPPRRPPALLLAAAGWGGSAAPLFPSPPSAFFLSEVALPSTGAVLAHALEDPNLAVAAGGAPALCVAMGAAARPHGGGGGGKWTAVLAAATWCDLPRRRGGAFSGAVEKAALHAALAAPAAAVGGGGGGEGGGGEGGDAAAVGAAAFRLAALLAPFCGARAPRGRPCACVPEALAAGSGALRAAGGGRSLPPALFPADEAAARSWLALAGGALRRLSGDGGAALCASAGAAWEAGGCEGGCEARGGGGALLAAATRALRAAERAVALCEALARGRAGGDDNAAYDELPWLSRTPAVEAALSLARGGGRGRAFAEGAARCGGEGGGWRAVAERAAAPPSVAAFSPRAGAAAAIAAAAPTPALAVLTAAAAAAAASPAAPGAHADAAELWGVVAAATAGVGSDRDVGGAAEEVRATSSAVSATSAVSVTSAVSATSAVSGGLWGAADAAHAGAWAARAGAALLAAAAAAAASDAVPRAPCDAWLAVAREWDRFVGSCGEFLGSPEAFPGDGAPCDGADALAPLLRSRAFFAAWALHRVERLDAEVGQAGGGEAFALWALGVARGAPPGPPLPAAWAAALPIGAAPALEARLAAAALDAGELAYLSSLRGDDACAALAPTLAAWAPKPPRARVAHVFAALAPPPARAPALAAAVEAVKGLAAVGGAPALALSPDRPTEGAYLTLAAEFLAVRPPPPYTSARAGVFFSLHPRVARKLKPSPTHANAGDACGARARACGAAIGRRARRPGAARARHL
jgi:hypothetical protein